MFLSGAFAVAFLAYSFVNAARLAGAWENMSVVNGTDVWAGVLLLLALAAKLLADRALPAGGELSGGEQQRG
jgi:hypothetical protein